MAPHEVVLVKSPLAIVGLFLIAIRGRFDPANVVDTFPWKYNADPNKSQIYIEAGAGDEVQQKDVRPGIYVGRSPIIFPKVVIGDMAGTLRQEDKRAYYSTATGQIVIDCLSKNNGESAVLAEIVQSFILMTSDLILSRYALRDITPVTLGSTEVWEKDNRLFNTRVTSEISYDVRWVTTPAASKLALVNLKLSSVGSDVFHEMALSSLTR